MEHGLINGSVAHEHWQIHPDEPLSAKGECHWTDELERDGICLRTEAHCRMWSDQNNFYLCASIEAYENNKLIYNRSLTDQISRDNM